MARSMNGSKYFSGTASPKEFIISQDDFIYKQLNSRVSNIKPDQKNNLFIYLWPALTFRNNEKTNDKNDCFRGEPEGVSSWPDQ